jgi:alanine dehydrogenase
VIIGTVCEIKDEEYRVGLAPEGVDDLVRLGHQVLVETGAGAGSGFSDGLYEQHGAQVVASAGDVWGSAELIVKVKEPLAPEFGVMRHGQTLFTYLHLAAAPEATRALIEAGTTSIAYETVQLQDGSLPLLIPMSQIAGRMATLAGQRWLQHPGPGRGKLLSGMPGSRPARVVILGAGTVSTNACDVAVALGAQVTVVSERLSDLRLLEDRWPNRLTTLPSTAGNIERAIAGADLLVSGVLVPGGAAAPRLVSRKGMRLLGEGAVAVDVSIDQGGSFETSRPTSHSDPVFVEEGVVHYCVPNMPGAVPHSSTLALTAATLSYVIEMARLGVDGALTADPALARGLMTREGELVNAAVKQVLGR